jgi:carbamoyl-phosphate synthase small subunit
MRNKIPAITGVDTRAITQQIRDNGALLSKIMIGEDKIEWYNPNHENLTQQVTNAKLCAAFLNAIINKS